MRWRQTFKKSNTRPYWTLFVPSAETTGPCEGPVAIPVARGLHASLAATTMSVAMGESVANMLQPFWGPLPILAIAGIPMRRVMGSMGITFVISFIAFGAALLFLVPRGQGGPMKQLMRGGINVLAQRAANARSLGEEG